MGLFLWEIDMQKIQQFIEQQYSQKYATDVLKEWLLESDHLSTWENMYMAWLDRDYEWEPKQLRTNAWAAEMRAEDSCMDFMVTVLAHILAKPGSVQLQEIMSSCAHLVTSTEDEVSQLHTVGEFLNLFQYAGMYLATKSGAKGYRYLVPSVRIPNDIKQLINNCQYLPPVVVPPPKIGMENKVDWATFSKSIFLRKHHHGKEVDTRFLDIMNSTPMTLDKHMLKYKDGDTKQTDERVKAEAMTELMKRYPKFYFIYRYDARLRSYSSGYQLNPMGTDYKKSQLNLFKEELCTDEIL